MVNCEGFIGTTIKDTWTKTRRGWKQGREMGMAGVVGRMGGRQKTALEQQ